MFRIAICDDDQIIVTQMEQIILEYAHDHYFNIEVEVFSDGRELCRCIEMGEKFDLIFLDIEMKYTSGIEAGEYIRQTCIDYMTKIVFISGKDGYERQLFEVQPFNFLPKPIVPIKICAIVELVLKIENISDEMYLYKKGASTYKVPIKNIKYFESNNREIKICTVDGEDYFYGKLNDVYEKVQKYKFIRSHKSYVINYQHIYGFKSNQIIMLDGAELPIGKSYHKDVKQIQLKFEEESLI